MKQYLAKFAVVAVALAGVLSAQSEAAVVVAHHGGAKVQHVEKAKHDHRNMNFRKDKHECKRHHKFERSCCCACKHEADRRDRKHRR